MSLAYSMAENGDLRKQDGVGESMPVPILLYHGVLSEPQAKDRYGLSVRVEEFEKQMRYLHDNGYQTLSLSERNDGRERSVLNRHKAVILTFDDGYDDFYREAFPILQRYRMNATVFVVTGYVGLRSGWDDGPGKWLLTWDQIGELRKYGVTFGSHTRTHRRLTTLPVYDAREELIRSKQCLEEKLDERVEFLAYPYGQSDMIVQTLAQGAGYRAACGVRSGRYGTFNILRREMLASDTMMTFRMKLGLCHRLPFLIRRKTVFATMVRRLIAKKLNPF